MSLPARREALAALIQALDAEQVSVWPDECQDAEVLEQGLNAAQERWARLVSDVVCGRPR